MNEHALLFKQSEIVHAAFVIKVAMADPKF